VPLRPPLPLTSLAIAALIGLTACGSSSAPEPDSAGDASSRATSTTQQASGEHNQADVMFAQLMIPHHQQAVDMGEMMLAKDGLDPDITSIATTIKDAQAPEITLMTDWLEAWGESSSMGDHAMHSMDGMLTEDQLAALEGAQGEEASRLFLESMIAHHEGAVTMAQDEVDDGQNSSAVDLAGDIIEIQKSEIEDMQQLMDGL
jgi:uncharacterized protein (DUF305 family)